MKVADEIQILLDDHILNTQQLSFSQFKAALEDEIDEWYSRFVHYSQNSYIFLFFCNSSFIYKVLKIESHERCHDFVVGSTKVRCIFYILITRYML